MAKVEQVFIEHVRIKPEFPYNATDAKMIMAQHKSDGYYDEPLECRFVANAAPELHENTIDIFPNFIHLFIANALIICYNLFIALVHWRPPFVFAN